MMGMNEATTMPAKISDDPRMGEFEDLLGVLLVEAQSVAVGEQSAAVAAERKRALRAWATAQMKRLDTLAAFARTAPGRLPAEVQAAVDSVPWDGEAVRALASEPVADELPAGERADLVRECREKAAWFESCRESAGYPRPSSGDTAALLARAADALETGPRIVTGPDGDYVVLANGSMYAVPNEGGVLLPVRERRLDPEGVAAPSLANSPTEPASSLASRVDQLAARVAELEDRVERLGDDSQEHHDRLWTLEDRYDRLDGIDRELGEANRRAIAKAGDKNVPDSVTAEIDAALLALYLEGVESGFAAGFDSDDRTDIDGIIRFGSAYWRNAKLGDWPARDRVRALLTERREG